MGETAVAVAVVLSRSGHGGDWHGRLQGLPGPALAKRRQTALHVGSDGSNWSGGPSKRNRNRLLTPRGPNSPRATLELVVTSLKFEES